MGFVGLYTGLSGIRAAQAGIDTTSNNIANANTPGYTRQRVEVSPSHTFQSGRHMIGTGVKIDAIARLRDQFLDDRFRTAIGTAAEETTRFDFLRGLETLSGEPDSGISSRMPVLWSSLESWNNDPSSGAARREVLGSMSLIAEGFRATAESWERLGEDTAERRTTAIDTANDLLRQIHELNLQMANAEASRVGPELADQRDMMVDEVAELLGTTARAQPDGSVTIRLGDRELVALNVADGDPRGFATLRLSDDGQSIEVSALGEEPADPGGTFDAINVGGEIAGLQRVLTQDLPEWLGELNALAEQFAGALNRVNAEGLRADGTSGEDLLAFDPGDAARTLAVADGVTPASLAAGQGDPGTPPSVHDATNARAFTELRTARLDAAGNPDANGRSIDNNLADLIVGLASTVRSTRAGADASLGIATGASLARAAEHGVSIDEEMVGLIRYQRALEASARVMTAVDEALDVLVNRVGLVGR